MITRRNGLLLALAAPMLVRQGICMPIKPLKPDPEADLIKSINKLLNELWDQQAYGPMEAHEFLLPVGPSAMRALGHASHSLAYDQGLTAFPKLKDMRIVSAPWKPRKSFAGLFG